MNASEQPQATIARPEPPDSPRRLEPPGLPRRPPVRGDKPRGSALWCAAVRASLGVVFLLAAGLLPAAGQVAPNQKQPDAKPADAPAPKPEEKPEEKPETKPEVKPDTKPEPKPESEPTAEETLVEIDLNGQCRVVNHGVDVGSLVHVLKSLRNAKVVKASVLVRAQKQCDPNLVTAATNACKAAGIQKVRVAIVKDTRPPNVLLILVDDLGYGDLGCYGATDLHTPCLDQLAGQGMRWTRFYANCPVCSPTRAALLAGRYQEAVGVPGVIRTHAKNSWGLLSTEAELLPAAVRQANYRTVMVGKWHLGLDEPNLPNPRGFQFFYGFLGDMMDDYHTHRRHDINYMRLDRYTIDPAGHATDLFSDWATEWIRNWRGQERFFMYLAYNAPHDPIQPPDDFLARYRKRHPEATEKRAKLAALIEHLDAGIGRVLAALDETRQADNTLVLFTSDNGGSLPAGANNGPLRDGKGKLYEGGIRVPMIARWPDRIPPGSTTDAVALSMDLYPTVLEAAGQVPDSAALDGVSLLPVLRGEAKELPQREVFFSRRMPAGTIEAVRRGRYKLLRPWPREAMELYDLADDSKETKNLASEKPDVRKQLQAALDAHVARYAKVPYRPSGGVGPGEIAPKP